MIPKVPGTFVSNETVCKSTNHIKHDFRGVFFTLLDSSAFGDAIDRFVWYCKYLRCRCSVVTLICRYLLETSALVTFEKKLVLKDGVV